MDQDLPLKRLADLNRGRIGEEVLVVEDDHKVSLLGDGGEVLDVGGATVSHHVELRSMGDDAHAESLGEDAGLVATDLVGFNSKQSQGLVADLMAVGVVLVPDTVMSLARAAEELAGEDDGQREAELADSIRRRSRVQCQNRDLQVEGTVLREDREWSPSMLRLVSNAGLLWGYGVLCQLKIYVPIEICRYLHG